jgi:hypothetical protein
MSIQYSGDMFQAHSLGIRPVVTYIHVLDNMYFFVCLCVLCACTVTGGCNPQLRLFDCAN